MRQPENHIQLHAATDAMDVDVQLLVVIYIYIYVLIGHSEMFPAKTPDGGNRRAYRCTSHPSRTACCCTAVVWVVVLVGCTYERPQLLLIHVVGRTFCLVGYELPKHD